MKSSLLIFAVCACFYTSLADVYLEEKFSDGKCVRFNEKIAITGNVGVSAAGKSTIKTNKTSTFVFRRLVGEELGVQQAPRQRIRQVRTHGGQILQRRSRRPR